MKVVNLTYTEVFDIRTSAKLKVANTARFTNDELKSLKNTIKEISQYNDSLVSYKSLETCVSFCIIFKAWYRIYKVEENEIITWKVREETQNTSYCPWPDYKDLITPEYNFDSFIEMIDWLKNTFEK